MLSILAIPVDNDDDDDLPQLVSSPRLGVLPLPCYHRLSNWSAICGNIDKDVIDYAYVDCGGDVVKERKLDSRNNSVASSSFNLS